MKRWLRCGSSALCIVVSCAGVALTAQSEAGLEGGVHIVRNAATPQHPPLRLEPERLWEIGGDSEAEGEFFGWITDIAVDAAGNVYLLDRQLSEVKVFDADGAWLRTIGREGEGPGEFRRPSALFLLANGDVGVVQSRPARLVTLTPEGDPAEPFPMPSSEAGGFRSIMQGSFRGGSMVFLGSNFKRQETSFTRSTALVRIDTDGNEVARFHDSSVTYRMGAPVIREKENFRVPWAVFPDGRVAACKDFDYEIHVWHPNGDLDRVIRRDYESLRRSKAAIESRKEELATRVRFRRRRSAPTVEVEPREPDIRGLTVTDDGHMWVLTSRGVADAPEGCYAIYDLLDPQGHYLQQVSLYVDGRFEDDRLVLAADRLFLIRQYASAERAWLAARRRAPARGDDTDEADDSDDFEDAVPMSVVCYRLGGLRAAASPAR